MKTGRILQRFLGDQRGAAAVEMALIGTFLAGVLVNAVEVGRYASMSGQVAAASQAGAHAVIINCEAGATPVNSNCPEADAASLAAVRGASLGTAVTRKPITEAWYCVTGNAALAEVGPADDRPDNCEAVGDAAQEPALYVQVRAAYDYAPLFPGLTIAETFAPTIVRSAWMRLR